MQVASTGLWMLAVVLVPSLVVALRPGVPRSRRALAGMLVLLVPIAGLILAVIVRRARGGAVACEPEIDEPLPPPSAADLVRLGEQPPVLDRLLVGDQAERLEALVALSSAGDAAAVAVLRWAIEHGPSDVVLDAALTLEEIELRAQARLISLRSRLDACQDGELAVATADAAAAMIHDQVADPAMAPAIAEQARAGYHLALTLAPERTVEIEEKLARLELAAGRPRVALGILNRLTSRDGANLVRLAQLRDDAAFAARDFDVLSASPSALELPPDLTARRLQKLRA